MTYLDELVFSTALEKSTKTANLPRTHLDLAKSNGSILVLPLLDFSEALAQLSATHILKLFISLALVHFSSLFCTSLVLVS